MVELFLKFEKVPQDYLKNLKLLREFKKFNVWKIR